MRRNLPRAHAGAGLELGSPVPSVSSGGKSLQAISRAEPPGCCLGTSVQSAHSVEREVSSAPCASPLRGLTWETLPTLLRACHFKGLKLEPQKPGGPAAKGSSRCSQASKPAGLGEFRAGHPARPPEWPEGQQGGLAGHEQGALLTSKGRMNGCGIQKTLGRHSIS